MITPNENGWTTNKISLEWHQHFEHHTSSQTRGKYRLLTLDGTSYILQPLDVGWPARPDRSGAPLAVLGTSSLAFEGACCSGAGAKHVLFGTFYQVESCQLHIPCN